MLGVRGPDSTKQSFRHPCELATESNYATRRLQWQSDLLSAVAPPAHLLHTCMLSESPYQAPAVQDILGGQRVVSFFECCQSTDIYRGSLHHAMASQKPPLEGSEGLPSRSFSRFMSQMASQEGELSVSYVGYCPHRRHRAEQGAGSIDQDLFIQKAQGSQAQDSHKLLGMPACHQVLVPVYDRLDGCVGHCSHSRRKAQPRRGSADQQLLGVPAGHQVLVPVEEVLDRSLEAPMHLIHLLLAWTVDLLHCRAQAIMRKSILLCSLAAIRH